MLLKVLILIGSSIFLVLGTVHLIYTFFSNKFDPYNTDAYKAMNETSPRLTRETTVWRAWIGFNASHSVGAMFFGAATIYLVFFQFYVLESSAFYLLLCTVNALFYLFLARKYWFRVPMIGITISVTCFIISLILILIG